MQASHAASVGGLTCGSAGLGSGRPHHITSSTSQHGPVGLMGAVKPSHPILPHTPPLAIFSVSFLINVTAFVPTKGCLRLNEPPLSSNHRGQTAA